MAAASVNRPDLLQRQWHYPPRFGASDLPGLKLVGEIIKCGASATIWQVGDKIYALVAGGG